MPTGPPGHFSDLKSSVRHLSAAVELLARSPFASWGTELAMACDAGKIAVKYARAGKKFRAALTHKIQATEPARPYQEMVGSALAALRNIDRECRASWRQQLARR